MTTEPNTVYNSLSSAFIYQPQLIMQTSNGMPPGHASEAALSVLGNTDLMAQVYLELGRSDLARCVRVNRQMRDSAAKALYHTMSSKDLMSITRSILGQHTDYYRSCVRHIIEAEDAVDCDLLFRRINVLPRVKSYSYRRVTKAQWILTLQLECSRVPGHTKRYLYRIVQVSSEVCLYHDPEQEGPYCAVSTMTLPHIHHLAAIRHRVPKCKITCAFCFHSIPGFQAHGAYRWLGDLTICWTTSDTPVIQLLEWIKANSAVGGLRRLGLHLTRPDRKLLASITRCCPRLIYLDLVPGKLDTFEYDLSEAGQILTPLRLLEHLHLPCFRINVEATLAPPPTTPSMLRSPVFPKLLYFCLECPSPTPDDVLPLVNWALWYLPRRCKTGTWSSSSRILEFQNEFRNLVEDGRNRAYDAAFKNCTWWKLPLSETG